MLIYKIRPYSPESANELSLWIFRDDELIAVYIPDNPTTIFDVIAEGEQTPVIFLL